MLMQSGIKKDTLGAPTQIDAFPQTTVAVGIVVAQAVVASADASGKKIAKAGTPLHGDLTARTTAFVKAADDSTGSAGDGKPAVGVLLHDVDLTAGAANATLMIGGWVDLKKVDATTAALITATRKSELNMIGFIK